MNVHAKNLYFSVFLLFINLFLSGPALAQIEEEIRILQMYFKEDELVVTPTRTPKPLSQVAENISVITSEEIEEMNAHTVAEVLERVTGIFVDFGGHDFGSTAMLQVQGSSERHVLVLLDGVSWNFMAGGNAVTNSIPVRIIERIEVIKGPASSAWGSSLGGVINIVTKNAGNTVRPTGSVSASYGERNTQDYRAEVTGKAGSVGYYLFAGRQDSDGLRNHRYFENDNLYSKFDIPFSSNVKLSLTAGYSEPHINFGDYPSSNITSTGIIRAFFTTASLSAALSRELDFEASFYTFKQKFVQSDEILNNDLVMGLFPISAGDLFENLTYDEKTTGGSSKIIWTSGMHTTVLGTDISDGRLDQTIDYGQVYQVLFGKPETSRTHPGIHKWAVFANDTITTGKFSITPGIRYDRNNVTGSFTSPSLGATYKLGEYTILRASVAKGFTTPPLSFTSGGGLFLDPNPSLKPEKVWSYQAGIESRVTDYFRANATIFHHDIKDALQMSEADPSSLNKIFFNNGDIRREGLELNTETIPFYNISFKAGFAYIHIKPSPVDTANKYACNLTVKYDDRKSFMAQLSGHYTWWDLDDSAMAKYDTFIWDLNLRKKIYSTEMTDTEIFLTAHNIFNGSYYTVGDTKNPRRWLEAGLRFKF
jgi:vitamin B12 transporter